MGGQTKPVIMMHNPKVAGSYLMTLLKENNIRHKRSSHDNVTTVQRIVGAEAWKRSFKFAFVRNPWDRLASWYFFHTKLFDKMDFPGFVDVVCSGDLDKIQEAVMFTAKPFWMSAIKRGMVNPLPQKQYTDGVDFVGKYENLHEDTDKFMQKIGIKTYKGIAPVNVSPHKKKGYHQYYTPKTRDMVAKLFEDDIQEFGYEF